MPYGVKRLYQDLWYSFIDRVLEKISFFDLPEGDGSIYCISQDLPEGSCKAVIEAAEEIEANAIRAFDLEFQRQLSVLLKRVPQLRKPFESFMERYTQKSGKSFTSLETNARFIFHYSWVDEGLWGLKTKSHYSVSGDSLIELARLEKLAGHGEYLMTPSFYEQWIKEDPSAHRQYEFDKRSKSLKGIGDFEYIIVKRKSEFKFSAA
jgi:hypothetical protein